MTQPLISICIPAYKRISFLKRLLDSIAEQSFSDFEVVITDDSPDNQVESFMSIYAEKFPILYQKNREPLGSPANWNAAIYLAKGTWIKIMHDDDWFVSIDSLAIFAKAAKSTAASFIFSGFINQHLDKGTSSRVVLSAFDTLLLKQTPLCIFRRNLIGHPSTTLIRNNRSLWFDEKIKWVVDLEFYIRILKEDEKFSVIKKPLINIGIGEEQITKIAFRNPEIEIPENFYLLTIIGQKALRNIFVYDYFWRLLRNLEISNAGQILHYIPDMIIPQPILRIIKLQSVFGQKTMKNWGLYSKSVMFLGYLVQYFKTSSSS